MGKSTLVNALIPGAERAIGAVNAVTGRGRHTSSAAIALRLPDAADAWVIDTPGVRSFGLSHVTPDRIVAAFPDLAAIMADCPRGCPHDDRRPECALDDAVADGRLALGPAGVFPPDARVRPVAWAPCPRPRPRPGPTTRCTGA